jgi:carbonic anhydrase/acetyltransferase-like protein (isoleucine patch superfamily)
MTSYRLGAHEPRIAADAFVAPGTHVIGQVALGERVSVWFGAVLRGDNEPIVIGADSNVQEGCVLHNDPGFPLTVGRGVTIGHQAMVHGCTIGDHSLIGIQAVIMNGATIGRECLVASGALVTEGKSFPDRTLIMGVPAKVLRPLTDGEVAHLHESARDYAARGARYREQLAALPAAAAAGDPATKDAFHG